MPSTPSQKSIDVCRSAPTIVMWWTPWLWSLRIGGGLLRGRLVLDEFRLVLAALQGAPGHELDASPDDEGGAQLLSDRLGERVVGARPAGELDADRQRRLLLDPRRLRADEDVAADVGREAAHDLAHRRGEHVHAADDEHVVRSPHAPDPGTRPPARARAGAYDDVVARAEPQQRRGAVAQVREDELAGRSVLERERIARAGVDQLGVDVVARPEVHAVLRLALAPQRHADVADPHRLGDPCAPAFLERAAERGLGAAGLPGDEDVPHARRAQVHAALGRPLDEVGGVRWGQHGGLRLEQLDGPHQALGVAGADGDVAEADPLERGGGGARRERAGVVRRDDALAGLDARRRVAARGALDPVVEVRRRQRDVARRAGRAARRVDADDVLARRAQVRADRVLLGDRRADLGLLGERQARDVIQAARVLGRCDAELAAVERRALEQVGDLRAVGDVVDGALLGPRTGLDLGREDHGPRSYSIASSAAPAMRKPIGCWCSSARWARRCGGRARIATALTRAAGTRRA